MAKYRFHADPGHGWLAVKRAELERLGIADKISTYSYERGATAYLEEDCDAGVFLAAKKAKGEPVEFLESHTDRRSPVRSYATYRKPAPTVSVPVIAINRDALRANLFGAAS